MSTLLGPNGELDDRPDNVQVEELYDGTSITEDPEREPTPGELKASASALIAGLGARALKSPLDQQFADRSHGRPR